jgi:hypothetical protein
MHHRTRTTAHAHQTKPVSDNTTQHDTHKKMVPVAEVVGVAEDDVAVERLELLRRQPLHRALQSKKSRKSRKIRNKRIKE